MCASPTSSAETPSGWVPTGDTKVPSTPSNLPYLGRTGYRNLWLNTGHGTLGWTMAAGSGKRIVDMIVAGDGPVVA